MNDTISNRPRPGESTWDDEEVQKVGRTPSLHGTISPNWHELLRASVKPWDLMSTPPSDKSTQKLPAPEIPDQELLRCIGRGSFGEVWLSRGVTGVFRAVKVVRRQSFNHDRPYDREFRGIQNFEKISLTHPGLMALLQVGRDREAGYFFYVIEIADDVETGQNIDPESYVPRTLREEISRRGSLPLAECIEVGLALAASLAHLEHHSLIHRDVKPSNVIFVDGAPKFADIGLVSRIDDDTVGGACTVSYAPPEGPGGRTTDLYGLGRVLYEISTGQAQAKFPELPNEFLNGIQSRSWLELNKIVLRACAKEPKERFQSAQEMHAELLRLHRWIRSPANRPTYLGKPTETFNRTLKVYVSHMPGAETDAELMQSFQDYLPQHGIEIVAGGEFATGLEWVHQIESQIRTADVFIALLSDESMESEMVIYDIELAHETAEEQKGKPLIVPIRVNLTKPLPQPLAAWLNPLRNLSWQDTDNHECLIQDLVELLQSVTAPETQIIDRALEAVGGAMPLTSDFYIKRPTDQEFKKAVSRGDSIVMVKGARQIGKTSLLARGLQHARQAGNKVVMIDFQKLDAAHLESADALYMRLGDFFAEQLDLDVWPEEIWNKRRGANINFERYLRREVLGKTPGHLVWGLDEVDRLFTCDFGSEVFALFRSWHNERALDPEGPWSRLTLAIAYATEAHLFITDVNQSPFNVGTRLSLEDEFFKLLGGQPYLVRQALNELASGRATFEEFILHADRDEGIFGDHLRRILVLLAKDPDLCEVVRNIFRGQTCREATSFYRLRSAGLIKGDSPEQAHPRCEIYARYLKRHLL
jgi:serine/threonine protein kinase